ncbi:MAG: hypothetical protein K2K84_03760 [Muribaculaceae bacterium]|nr:hypothetical protein [Muribaculaceae bacterium]
MKFNYLLSCVFAATLALTSCGGSESSSTDVFGSIPETLAKYETESKGAKDATELKDKTKAEVEKEATELNGKEITCTVDDAQLKIEQPVTLEFKSMNTYRPVFGLGGKVVAAKDLTLNVDSSDLKGSELLGETNVVVNVKMPVVLEFLGKDGAVIKRHNDVGTLDAENNGTTAIVKAGTPVDFSRSFTVDDKLAGVESIRLFIELDKAPYTSRSLK